jgi:hypothetical protein
MELGKLSERLASWTYQRCPGDANRS